MSLIQVAKHLSTTNRSNGFMEEVHECKLDGSKIPRVGGSHIITCKLKELQPHNIKWQCSHETHDDGDLDLHQHGEVNITTTLMEADRAPVFFELTWTRGDGTPGKRDFQLSRPGESQTIGRFCRRSYLTYKIRFRYPDTEQPPVAELPSAVKLASPDMASPCSPKLKIPHEFDMHSGKYSDVTVTARSKVFKLHKVVLASSSDVFDRMFNTDMQEKNTNVVVLDMENDIAEAMIRFIYTGKIEGREELTAELINLAEQYKLENLKQMCLQELVKNLNESNAAAALILTDLYTKDEEDYKKSVMKYISENFHEVILTDGWRQLQAENFQLSQAMTFFDKENKNDLNLC